MNRALLFLVLASVLLAGCTDGSNDNETTESITDGPGDHDPTPDPSPPDPDAPEPAVPGFPPELGPATMWHYHWITDERTTAQRSGTTHETRSGDFQVILGDPVPMRGATMYPVRVEGENSDGSFDYGPHWTHLGVVGNSLVGSTGTTGLQVIFDADTGEWMGGGFFTEFPDGARVTASPSTVSNAFIRTAAHAVSLGVDEGGCTYYPETGDTICDDDSTTINDREYYKEGLGPVGYTHNSTFTYSGGGHYSAYHTQRQLGLVATTLQAPDGFEPEMPPWTEAASLLTPRKDLAAVASDDRIYVLGGHTWSGESWQALRSIEIYDPQADAWTQGADAPVDLRDPSAAILDGEIHVLTSTLDRLEHYIYDPATDSWRAGVHLEAPIRKADVAVFGGDLLVVGQRGYDPTLQVWIHRADSGPWIEGFHPDFYQNGYAFAATQDHVYLVGHVYDDPSPHETVHRYDPYQGGWSESTELNTARAWASGASLDGQVYVFGGHNDGPIRSVERYDPADDTWVKLPDILQDHRDGAAVALDGKLYVIGGNDPDTMDVVEVLNPVSL